MNQNLENLIKSYTRVCKSNDYQTVTNIINGFESNNPINTIASNNCVSIKTLNKTRALYSQFGGNKMMKIADTLCEKSNVNNEIQSGGINFSSLFTSTTQGAKDAALAAAKTASAAAKTASAHVSSISPSLPTTKPIIPTLPTTKPSTPTLPTTKPSTPTLPTTRPINSLSENCKLEKAAIAEFVSQIKKLESENEELKSENARLKNISPSEIRGYKDKIKRYEDEIKRKTDENENLESTILDCKNEGALVTYKYNLSREMLISYIDTYIKMYNVKLDASNAILKQINNINKKLDEYFNSSYKLSEKEQIDNKRNIISTFAEFKSEINKISNESDSTIIKLQPELDKIISQLKTLKGGSFLSSLANNASKISKHIDEHVSTVSSHIDKHANKLKEHVQKHAQHVQEIGDAAKMLHDATHAAIHNISGSHNQEVQQLQKELSDVKQELARVKQELDDCNNQ